jgi:transposase-like protein
MKKQKQTKEVNQSIELESASSYNEKLKLLSEQVKELVRTNLKNSGGALLKEFQQAAQEGDPLKFLTKPILELMLESEMDEHLGYNKHNLRTGTNARNGKGKKIVRGDFGELEISTPRDRESTFEPIAIPKRQHAIGKWSDKIISLYAKGLSVHDIRGFFEDSYGIDVSEQFISNVTQRVKGEVESWQSRPLERVYPIVYIDGIHVNVRGASGTISKHCVHIAMGVRKNGTIEVLGLWIEEHEGASHWLSIFNEFKSRGVEDILIICSDGLKGVPEAIAATFPKTDLQLCIVHQIRNSTKFIPFKDRKAFCADAKNIYNAPTARAAELALEQLKNSWYSKYPASVDSWINNWDKLITFFKYPVEIRKSIYTTNNIECLNSVLRQHIRNKKVFPSVDAARKMLFLVISNMDENWGKKNRDWNLCVQQFALLFHDRFSIHDILS